MLNAQTAHLRFKKSQCPVHHIPDVKRADAFDIFFSLTRAHARETKKIKTPSVDRHPAVINRAQTIEFTLAVYFPAYPGNSAPAVWPQNSPGSAVGVRQIFGDDTFGDPADNRRVEPAG